MHSHSAITSNSRCIQAMQVLLIQFRVTHIQCVFKKKILVKLLYVSFRFSFTSVDIEHHGCVFGSYILHFALCNTLLFCSKKKKKEKISVQTVYIYIYIYSYIKRTCINNTFSKVPLYCCRWTFEYFIGFVIIYKVG